MHRGLIKVGSVAVLAACVGACGEGASTARERPPGPLARGNAIESTEVTGQRRGAPFTWGGPVLTNRGKRPARLERATVLGAAPRILGTAVFGPGASYAIGDDPAWPPRDAPRRQVHEVRGTVIPPGERAQVIVGIHPNRDGDFLLRGFRVDYRIDGERYSAVYRIRLRLCIGPHPRTCSRRYDSHGMPRTTSPG